MKALLGIAKAAPATLFRRPARLKVVTPGLSPPPPMSSVAKLLRRARERELPRAPAGERILPLRAEGLGDSIPLHWCIA